MKEVLLSSCRGYWNGFKAENPGGSSEEAFVEAVEKCLPESVCEAFMQCYALDLVNEDHYLDDLSLSDKDTIVLSEVAYAVLRRFYYDSGMLKEAQKEDDGRVVICVGGDQ